MSCKGTLVLKVVSLARFPSDEWAKLFMEQVNANKKYEDAAKTWEGDFLFVVNADVELKEPATIYMDLWHGKCRSAALLKPGEEKKAAYVYSGPYGNWKKLINKQIDPIQGLLTGKFKLQGDMGKVLRAVRAAKELVETAGTVPTEFA
jgi:putative sterol carrier protein